MTRKKFIKCVMGKGISRNHAEWLTVFCELYGSYKELYRWIAPEIVQIDIILRSHSGHLGKVITGALRLGELFRKGRWYYYSKSVCDLLARSTMKYVSFFSNKELENLCSGMSLQGKPSWPQEYPVRNFKINICEVLDYV